MMKPRQLQLLGLDRFPANITEFDIHQFFIFGDEERRVINGRRGSRGRVGLAIQLGFMRMTGRPLANLDTVPRPLLRHLRGQLGVEAPDLATLRTLYENRRTLFDHQRAAASLLGFRPFSSGRQSALSRHLRSEANLTRSSSQLMIAARQWLYGLRVLSPGEKTLRRVVAGARAAVDDKVASIVDASVSEATRKKWLASVMKKHEGRRTVLEWLQTPPKRRSSKDFQLQADKLDFIKSMGMRENTCDGIGLPMQQAYAMEVRRRRPTMFKRLSEPRRTVALVCFLSVRMRELIDEIFMLSAMTGRKIVRQARDNARAKDAKAFGGLLEAVEGIREVLNDETQPTEQRCENAIRLLPVETASPSFASRLRDELSSSARRTRPMLRRLVKLPLSETDERKEMTKALQTLSELYEQRATRLPDDVDASFAPRWTVLIKGDDRKKALRSYETAVLQELHQRLRSGAVWVDASIEHRGFEESLIPVADWKKNSAKHFRTLAVSENSESQVSSLKATLETGLQALGEAITAKAVEVDGRRIRLAKLKKESLPDELESGRRKLVDAVGNIQLPDLLVEMDAHVRFSSTILGRSPRSDKELLALYGALLAHGTEQDAAGIALMTPGLKAEAIVAFMHLFDEPRVLRKANAATVEFLRQHAVVNLWGDGSLMSSDSMSLEATRHLWKARVDPKRRRYAVGMYTHLLAQWGIVYDQPAVLGERQAGFAIEGALRQISDAKPTRLAVDTHGYTNFGMGIAKFLGLDLCPRLRDLRNRILYVPKDIEVPEALQSVVSRDISMAAIHDGWSELGRVAASIKCGKTSAASMLGRLGSASRDRRAHKAGSMLGKLLRTLFLIDYFTNPDFRRELLRVLNYGESVHQLQRAIYAGNIAAKQGRRTERLQAISGSLTLLTNLVMAWTTHRLQLAVDGPAKDVATADVLRHVAPDQFKGINMRGLLRFPIGEHRERLIAANG